MATQWKYDERKSRDGDVRSVSWTRKVGPLEFYCVLGHIYSRDRWVVGCSRLGLEQFTELPRDEYGAAIAIADEIIAETVRAITNDAGL